MQDHGKILYWDSQLSNCIAFGITCPGPFCCQTFPPYHLPYHLAPHGPHGPHGFLGPHGLLGCPTRHCSLDVFWQQQHEWQQPDREKCRHNAAAGQVEMSYLLNLLRVLVTATQVHQEMQQINHSNSSAYGHNHFQFVFQLFCSDLPDGHHTTTKFPCPGQCDSNNLPPRLNTVMTVITTTLPAIMQPLRCSI
jgi:hypothetical protein